MCVWALTYLPVEVFRVLLIGYWLGVLAGLSESLWAPRRANCRSNLG